jgi:hypothetical protein
MNDKEYNNEYDWDLQSLTFLNLDTKDTYIIFFGGGFDYATYHLVAKITGNSIHDKTLIAKFLSERQAAYNEIKQSRISSSPIISSLKTTAYFMQPKFSNKIYAEINRLFLEVEHKMFYFNNAKYNGFFCKEDNDRWGINREGMIAERRKNFYHAEKALDNFLNSSVRDLREEILKDIHFLFTEVTGSPQEEVGKTGGGKA